MAGSIFDLPENRDGSRENLGIPSNKTRNNQTTETDFDVYYDLATSLYSSDAVNKVFAYRAERDNFEFQNTFNKTLQAMVTDKMMISKHNDQQIAEAIAKMHDKNTDLMICGKLGINPPKIVVACENEDMGAMLQICTPEGKNFITIVRDYDGGVIKNIVKGLYINGENILHLETTLRRSPLVKDMLDNMVRRQEIFDRSSDFERSIRGLKQCITIDDFYKEYIRLNQFEIFIQGAKLKEHDYTILNEYKLIKLKDEYKDCREVTLRFNGLKVTKSLYQLIEIPDDFRDSVKKGQFDLTINGVNIDKAQYVFLDNYRYICLLLNNYDNTSTVRLKFYSDCILDKHIHYIMERTGTRLDRHIKDNSIHVTEDEKRRWFEKYDLPEGGIPIHDLHSDVQYNINESFVHSLSDKLHVSETDRVYWNSKFDMPMSGINESHLSMSLQNKLQNVFSIYDIVDSDTGNIREELLPNYNYDEIFLKKQTYNNYLENDWRLHIENKVDNNIHVNWEEKDRWNESYQRTLELPQRLSNIENNLIGVVKEKDIIDGTIKDGGTIKKELVPFATEIESIILHMSDTRKHLSPTEKNYISKLGDPSLLQTKNKTIVGAINELYDMLQELLAETHIVTKK